MPSIRNEVGVYDEANRDMLAQYLKHNTPQGEILFLAADPESKTKGIGSRLLQELERRGARQNNLSVYGRRLYLSVL